MAMYEYRIKIMYVMMQERKLISGVTEKDGVWQTDLGEQHGELTCANGRKKQSTWWRPWQWGTLVPGKHGVSSNCFLLIQELGNKVVS